MSRPKQTIKYNTDYISFNKKLSNNNQPFKLSNDDPVLMIEHQQLFIAKGAMENIIEIITEIPKILIFYFEQKKYDTHNGNIELLIKIWFSKWCNLNKEPICIDYDNKIYSWGIWYKYKNYYFICEKQNINDIKIKNKNGKIHPKYCLRYVRTDKTMDYESRNLVRLLDVCKMYKNIPKFNEKCEFNIHKLFKDKSKNETQKQLIKWLINNANNNICIPYHYIKSYTDINGQKKQKISSELQMAFMYPDRNDIYKNNNIRLTQLVLTIETTSNISNQNIISYQIIKIENKQHAFCKFGSAYISLLNDNDCNKKFKWFFDQNNINYITPKINYEYEYLRINNESIKLKKDNDAYKQTIATQLQLLNTWNNEINNLNEQILFLQNNNNILPVKPIGSNLFTNINNNIYMNNNKLDIFEQEIIMLQTKNIKIFNKNIKGYQNSHVYIGKNNKQYNNNNISIAYAAFISRQDHGHRLENKQKIYTALYLPTSLDGLSKNETLKKTDRIFVMKCEINKDIETILQAYSLQGYIIVEGKDIVNITHQKILGLKEN